MNTINECEKPVNKNPNFIKCTRFRSTNRTNEIAHMHAKYSQRNRN